MAKKSFKDNNPAMQFITPHKETQEEQTQQSTQKSKDTKESDKVKADKEVKVKEGKDKNAKVKEAKIKEINSVQIKEDDKEKKLLRIDKILTKDNLRFLKDITRSEGVSVFDYINRLVKEDQAKKSTEK